MAYVLLDSGGNVIAVYKMPQPSISGIINISDGDARIATYIAQQQSVSNPETTGQSQIGDHLLGLTVNSAPYSQGQIVTAAQAGGDAGTWSVVSVVAFSVPSVVYIWLFRRIT